MIYFDLCALQRPNDDQSQLRTRVESISVMSLLDFCWDGHASFANSDALVYEVSNNPNADQQDYLTMILSNATAYQPLTDAVQSRADELVASGIRPLDALHLASAEQVGAEYFCTCDDHLLRKGRVLALKSIRVVSPVELTGEMNL